jgi:hypothetical protein
MGVHACSLRLHRRTVPTPQAFFLEASLQTRLANRTTLTG